MYKQMCTCDPRYFNSVTGGCFACGGQGVLTQSLRPLSQSNCQHGSPYFNLVANRCVVCGVPGVSVPVPQQGLLGGGGPRPGMPQQGYPVGGGPFPPMPPLAPPMPNPMAPQTIGGLQALVNRPNAAPGAGAKVQVLEKMEPPKPTAEELLKRANDAFPVLTAKELLCHRCCVIMKPRIRLSHFGAGFVAEVTCHGVTDGVALTGAPADELRQDVVQMLQDIQGKNRDDWTF